MKAVLIGGKYLGPELGGASKDGADGCRKVVTRKKVAATIRSLANDEGLTLEYCCTRVFLFLF